MLSMNLVLSLVLGVLPLLGVAWTLVNGLITTVDGLFMSLILLALSATFLLNAYWEMRDQGMIGTKTTGKEKTAPPAAKSPAVKAS